MNNNCVPVAMFVYNRLDNVKKTVGCLMQNTLAAKTDLVVFSDGGRDETSWNEVRAVRRFFRESELTMHSVTVIERSVNYYLERNIIEGVTQMLEKHGRVIVLEDDICTSPYFLEYMNDALSLYEKEPRVMHISGFTNLNVPQKGDVYLTRHMAGWGWATWADRWRDGFVHYKSRAEALDGLTADEICAIEYGGKFGCLKSLDHIPIPWDICWEIGIRRRGGLCLSPTQTLVRNCGIGGGTHFHSKRLFGHYEYDRPYTCRRLDVSLPVIAADEEVETVLNPEALTDHGFRYNLLGRILRYFYLHLTRKDGAEKHTS